MMAGAGMRGRAVAAGVLLWWLAGCGSGGDGPAGPPPFKLCSGHGTYQLADNAQSACLCDPGYSEHRWVPPASWPLGLEYSFLCVANPPPVGLGLAAPDGQPPADAQAELLLANGMSVTEATLPTDLSVFPPRLTVVGRIMLDGAGLTSDRARELVDRAMSGQSHLQQVVLETPVMMDSTYSDVPGISDGYQMMEWLEQSFMPVLCEAVARTRAHCPWCAVGLASVYSPNEYVAAMGNRLHQAGKIGQCRIDFVEQHFRQVNPFLVESGKGLNLGALLYMNEVGFQPSWRVARIDSFLKGPFDLLNDSERGMAVVEATLRLRAMGFDTVILPNLEGVPDLPPGSVALTADGVLTAVGERLAVLARLLGPGRMTATETEGLFAAPATMEGLDTLLFVSLSKEALVPPEGSDWSYHTILDGAGGLSLLIAPFVPLAEQLAQAVVAELPCYLIVTPGAEWPPGAFGEPEQIFEEALADAGLFYPGGELALDLDGDPDLEWAGESGYLDLVDGSFFRRIATWGTPASTIFLDANRDGLVDLLTAGEAASTEGVGLTHLMLNRGGYFPLSAWEAGLEGFTAEHWTMDALVPQYPVADLDGDDLADLVGQDAEALVVYWGTEQQDQFVAQQYPGPGDAKAFRISDLDGDQAPDLLGLTDPLPAQEALLQLSGSAWFNRQGQFVPATLPCPFALGAVIELGLEGALGNGVLCVEPTGGGWQVSHYAVSGDSLELAFAETLEVQTGALTPLLLPFRESEGAPTRLLAAADTGLTLVEVVAGGLKDAGFWETMSMTVSGYYSAGPGGQTWLMAGGIRTASPAEATLLSVAPPGWAKSLVPGEQLLEADLNGDGKLDLVGMAGSPATAVTIEELGKPYVSWWERELEFRAVFGYLNNPDGNWQPVPQKEKIIFRSQNGCSWSVQTYPGGPPPWEHSFAAGSFDSEPGDDLFVYSIVRHSLKDIWPTGYVVSGKSGKVTAFDGKEIMEARVIQNSDCGTSTVLAANLDGDGIDDVLMWDRHNEKVHLLCSDNGPGLDQHRRHEVFGVGEPRIVRTLDFNQDGHTDIMVVRLSSVIFYLGNGQCEISGVREYSVGTNTQWHNDFACDDFDGDGDFECFFKCLWDFYWEREEEDCLAHLPPQGGFLPEQSWIPIGPPIPDLSWDARAGDFDGDGLPEILSQGSVLRFRDDHLSLLGTFFPVPAKVLGDLDGNGTDDVLTSSWTVLHGKKK